MRKIICLLLLLCLLISSSLLTGCRPQPSPTVSGSSATAGPTPIPLDKRLSLKPCAVSVGKTTAECGYLHVPEDRANPNSRILDLWTVVVRATGPDRQPDPLFYIVGGPGVAVTSESIITTSRDYIFKEINTQRDLVFIDQRGTNDLHLLTCAWPSFQILDAPQQQVDDWMKGCLAHLNSDPRFLLTAPAMQDLDEAREALGYDKINLYGISYGAAAVQVYMRMFPDHVRAAIIDHGTALDLPFFYAKPRASQMAVDQVLTYCEQDAACRAAFPNVRADWQAIINRLNQGPVVSSFTPPGATAPLQVDKKALATSVHHSLYGSVEYSQLPIQIHAFASAEDWTPLLKSDYEKPHPTTPDEPFQFMPNMIFCFEPAWGTDPAEVARLNPGSYFMEQAVDDTTFQQKVCAALPKPPSSAIYGSGKPAPLSALIFNSLLDPQNPPSNMDLALKEFTKSRMVVEPIEGHEPLVSDQCRWDIMAQYIAQGAVDGLDLSCIKEIKPSFVTGN